MVGVGVILGLLIIPNMIRLDKTHFSASPLRSRPRIYMNSTHLGPAVIDCYIVSRWVMVWAVSPLVVVEKNITFFWEYELNIEFH